MIEQKEKRKEKWSKGEIETKIIILWFIRKNGNAFKLPIFTLKNVIYGLILIFLPWFLSFKQTKIHK